MVDEKKVYAEKCLRYDVSDIKKILLDSLEFLDIKLPSKKNILLKPNVLGAYPPEKNVTTNPAIVEALIQILLEKKNHLYVGDSSGIRIKGGTDDALRVSGIKGLERKDVSVVSFDSGNVDIYENPNNKVLKQVSLSEFIKKVDLIVNIPKIKAHQFTKYTGAVKNFFGCIPGGTKQNCHVLAPNPERFSDLLIDIYSFVKDKVLINVMDGVEGLEGKGPGPSGDTKKTGFIAVSEDALALDFFCCSYINIDPLSIPTNQAGVSRGFFSGKFTTNKEIGHSSFILPKIVRLPDSIYSYFAGFSYPKPNVSIDACKKCAICFKACPTKAISMKPYPVFDRKKCIYCFCCHENCPAEAIYLKDNFFLRLYKRYFTK